VAIASAVLLGSAEAAVPTAASTDVVAHYQTYDVGRGDEVDIRLQGFHWNNKKYSFRLTTLPAEGSVYRPAANYCKYSYEPKLGGAAVAAADLPLAIDCDSVSLVYKYTANKMLPAEDHLDRFEYEVIDNASQKSYPGVVHLLNGDRVLAASFFNRDADGWTIVRNGPRSTSPAFDPTSRGMVNRFISAEEDSTDMVAGVDQDLWSFAAPAKFRRDLAAAYGGKLSFVLSSAAGDFSSLTPDAKAVKLACATCRSSSTQDRGVQLYFPASALSTTFDGSSTRLEVDLDETKGWLKDSENTQVAWTPPTQCEMVQVLKRLSGVEILGDWTKGFESVALDSVRLTAGPHMPLPLTCYHSMHFIV
jgi:hypothetical protein